ncbi:hypothetical protein HUW46_06056 [Amycolatopsis sp. CA-230715]|nr:hypothetical protein HUW46_06056 [Amycolatopsis sp. CA-230715]
MVRTGMRPRPGSPLANTEFRTLWFAEAQSLVGDQLTTVALAIMVYDRTGSALISALVFSLSFLPAIAGALGLAQLADRYPRRTVLSAAMAVQGLFVGLMAIPGTPLPVLCALVVVARLAGGPAIAAQNALTREVFTDDDLYLRSQDIRGITTNTATLAGLAGGGVLVVWMGPSLSLAIDAATFFVSAVVTRCLLKPRPAAGDGGGTWFGAIRWVFAERRLRVLIWLSWLVGIAVIPEGLVAPLAAEIGAGDKAVGWMLAADPLGFIIGAFVLSRWVTAENRRRVIGVLAVAPLATLALFVFRPSLPLVLLLLALAGATGAYLITVSATFLTWVPNELRGGAGGVYRTGLRVAQGIGAGLGGALAQLVGSPTTAIAIASAAGVVLAVPVAISWARVVAANRAR